ncbi:MAG: hypothetical protein ACOYM9_11875 [Bradymonadia bacterium]
MPDPLDPPDVLLPDDGRLVVAASGVLTPIFVRMPTHGAPGHLVLAGRPVDLAPLRASPLAAGLVELSPTLGATARLDRFGALATTPAATRFLPLVRRALPAGPKLEGRTTPTGAPTFTTRLAPHSQPRWLWVVYLTPSGARAAVRAPIAAGARAVSVDLPDLARDRPTWSWLVAEGAPVGVTLSQVATRTGAES